MNRFTAIITFLALSLSLGAQSKIFQAGDKVVVQISSKYGKVYVHEMSAQETVYSLAKTFSQKMGDVKYINPGVNFDAMKVGQKIRVPFMAASMIKDPKDLVNGGEYVNVYYKVRPKDNLYRIAKIYFDTSVEILMSINHRQSMDLKAEELIKVGWMPINNTPKAKIPQFDYSINTKEEQKKASTVIVQPTTSAPSSNSSMATNTPQTNSAPMAASKEKSNEVTRSSRTKTTSRKKAKKEGFFTRVFGSKNKKKKREEKDIKEVVELSEQLENKTSSPEKVTNTPQITQSPIVQQKEESPEFKTIVHEVEDEEGSEENLKDPEMAAETNYSYKSERGIAIWNQTSTNSMNMFALHPTAKVGSYIEITNPMMNKTVQAKVIGNIPPRTYTDDISIVVSPKVAEMLGVVDRRFAVRVKYREE